MFQRVALTFSLWLLLSSVVVADVAPQFESSLLFTGLDNYPEYDFYIQYTLQRARSKDRSDEKQIFHGRWVLIDGTGRSPEYTLYAVPKKSSGPPLMTVVFQVKSNSVTTGAGPFATHSDGSHRLHVTINDGIISVEPVGRIESFYHSLPIVPIVLTLAIISFGVWIVRRRRKAKRLKPTPSVS